VVRNSSRMPRALPLVVGVGIAVGLALAAPVRKASPSTDTARLVTTRLHTADRHPHGSR
jgi:hypothetical protein